MLLLDHLYERSTVARTGGGTNWKVVTEPIWRYVLRFHPPVVNAHPMRSHLEAIDPAAV